MGWGKIQDDGVEIWDSNPVFLGEQVKFKDWVKLLFYPKKWFLYCYIKKHINNIILAKAGILKRGKISVFTGMTMWEDNPAIRILDVGCGTGASLVDLKKMFGRKVEIYGVDVIKLQIDLAKEKIKQNGVHAEVAWYDGEHLPFENNYFDAIYTSDVLGHVTNAPAWLKELNRVLKSGGVLAMFSESKLGKHAYVRNYLMKYGLNVDPHAEFHISLYSKSELKSLLANAGFDIEKMYNAFWASFFVHPDEFYQELNNDNQHKFFILKNFNSAIYWLKKKTHPFSTAGCELYGLIEMYLVGK